MLCSHSQFMQSYSETTITIVRVHVHLVQNTRILFVVITTKNRLLARRAAEKVPETLRAVRAHLCVSNLPICPQQCCPRTLVQYRVLYCQRHSCTCFGSPTGEDLERGRCGVTAMKSGWTHVYHVPSSFRYVLLLVLCIHGSPPQKTHVERKSATWTHETSPWVDQHGYQTSIFAVRTTNRYSEVRMPSPT